MVQPSGPFSIGSSPGFQLLKLPERKASFPSVWPLRKKVLFGLKYTELVLPLGSVSSRTLSRSVVQPPSTINLYQYLPAFNGTTEIHPLSVRVIDSAPCCQLVKLPANKTRPAPR